ncbi:PREDICTED: LOW QUALITY PROTEIN: P-selectin glycoprotein ligand 1 [Propithecus coquereli]|uniref:LOW QUALITY PROTEIN: P-selectin glycoprotein ligand 1 n=1 Tax=Propithecus coquereli TaxID=379532 RepID=UPI00063F8F4D|nr:PREDICTED: LOW QUALITY PROTEIN: P-selectin glycoprotein ligand 1 [Propithecus coquereli]
MPLRLLLLLTLLGSGSSFPLGDIQADGDRKVLGPLLARGRRQVFRDEKDYDDYEAEGTDPPEMLADNISVVTGTSEQRGSAEPGSPEPATVEAATRDPAGLDTGGAAMGNLSTELATRWIPVTLDPLVTEPATVNISIMGVPSNKGALSTGPATMEAQTTQPAATEAPSTEPPATEAPTTEPPTTEALTTEPTATEAPTTEPPATEAPTTEPPATEALTTEPTARTTEPPATEALTTEPPATEALTTEPTATEALTTELPATEALTTELTVTEVLTTEPTTTEAMTTELTVMGALSVEPTATETLSTALTAMEALSTETPPLVALSMELATMKGIPGAASNPSADTNMKNGRTIPPGIFMAPTSTGPPNYIPVKQCLLAILILALVATIFLVCTVVLAVRLSRKNHTYPVRNYSPTEMVCISSLLPDGVEGRPATANGGLPKAKSEGLMPEPGEDREGDDLTLHSFLP